MLYSSAVVSPGRSRRKLYAVVFGQREYAHFLRATAKLVAAAFIGPSLDTALKASTLARHPETKQSARK